MLINLIFDDLIFLIYKIEIITRVVLFLINVIIQKKYRIRFKIE